MVIYKMVAIEIENMVDEMLECLDVDIEHIQKNLSRLNELRSLVIKRDDASLQALLDCIQAESENYKENELKRQMLRKILADSLGCNVEKITLSMLGNLLSIIKRNRVSERKSQLKTLIENFKREYANTIILLSECARFNRMMIKNIFNPGRKGSVYYRANGTITEQKDNSKSWLVNYDL
jgi:hypothetical protein